MSKVRGEEEKDALERELEGFDGCVGFGLDWNFVWNGMWFFRHA